MDELPRGADNITLPAGPRHAQRKETKGKSCSRFF